MDPTQLQHAREFAEDVCARAAVLANGMRGHVAAVRKPDDSFVTEADTRIETMIRDAVARQFPEHGFIGEESAGLNATDAGVEGPEYTWVVDPIDGTRNYTHGFPFACTSMALMRGAESIIGVVREHASGWRCSAVRGCGTTCCGQSAAVSTTDFGRDTMIAVPTGRNQPILPVLKCWADRYVLRNVGSTALHMALLAAGAVDAVLCFECKIWDVAAGVLLIGEAGGRCSDVFGRPLLGRAPHQYGQSDLPFLAANRESFEWLLQDVTQHYARVS